MTTTTTMGYGKMVITKKCFVWMSVTVREPPYVLYSDELRIQVNCKVWDSDTVFYCLTGTDLMHLCSIWASDGGSCGAPERRRESNTHTHTHTHTHTNSFEDVCSQCTFRTRGSPGPVEPRHSLHTSSVTR